MPDARQPLQQRQAVDLRQPQVEQHGVVAFGPHRKVGPLAVGRHVHGIPGVAQRARQVLRERRFVVNDENAHQFNARFKMQNANNTCLRTAVCILNFAFCIVQASA